MAEASVAVAEHRPRIGVGGVRITAKMYENVADVLGSGWLSPGKWCARFEREWADAHERRHAVFVNSGTSALQIGIHAMKEKHGWQPGQKVLVPALTFVASVNVIIQNGLNPVFVDIDPYYGIDLSAPPPADTVAIMAVHINGQQCSMGIVRAYAREHNLVIIEDSCETILARYCGVMCGDWGEVSAFSTYSCHHVTTGVGGFATTNDPETAALLRSLANHGRDGIHFEPGNSAEKLAREFRFERTGYSYRASEFEASIGVAQMATIREDLQQRRSAADWLSEMLRVEFVERHPHLLALPQARPGADWWPMFYPVLTPYRDSLALFLNEKGIDSRRMLPLTNQPVYRGIVREQDFPYAARVNREGLYVGIYPDPDVERIASAFCEFFSEVKR